MFFAAASTLTFAVVQAQGQILDTSSPDYQKRLKENSHIWNESTLDTDSMIGMCIYGAPNADQNPTLTTFDGEFEGLIPRDTRRELFKYGHGSINIKCSYETIFDDVPIRQASMDKVLAENSEVELINELDPVKRGLDKVKLNNLLEYYEDSKLNMKEKSPDYVVIDNFMEVFGLPKEVLQEARNEG